MGTISGFSRNLLQIFGNFEISKYSNLRGTFKIKKSLHFPLETDAEKNPANLSLKKSLCFSAKIQISKILFYQKNVIVLNLQRNFGLFPILVQKRTKREEIGIAW